MPRYILKLQGKKKTSYMVYSTIVDAPIVYDMTADEVREWWQNEYGKEGMRVFDAKMALVEKTGSSIGEAPKAVLSGNRAGNREGHMKFADIIATYVDLTKPEK